MILQHHSNFPFQVDSVLRGRKEMLAWQESKGKKAPRGTRVGTAPKATEESQGPRAPLAQRGGLEPRVRRERGERRATVENLGRREGKGKRERRG